MRKLARRNKKRERERQHETQINKGMRQLGKLYKHKNPMLPEAVLGTIKNLSHGESLSFKQLIFFQSATKDGFDFEITYYQKHNLFFMQLTSFRQL